MRTKVCGVLGDPVERVAGSGDILGLSGVGIGEARSDSNLPATMQVFQSFINQCCCYCV